MRHASCSRRLSEYADDTLAPGLRSRVDEHLAGCATCREELSALQATLVLLGALDSTEEPPPGLGDQVIARVRAGEADPGLLGRFAGRWQAWMDSSMGPPLLTAGVGLCLLVLVQGVQIEVSLPGFLGEGAEQDASVAAAPLLPARAVAASAASPLSARRRAVGIPAMPPLADCLRGAGPGCARWHAWHVGLGMREPRVFLREVENVPDRARDRWLAELSRYAAHSGRASVLAARLRESGDPRGQRVATHFEGIVGPRRR